MLPWAGADGSIADQPETSIAVLASVRDLRIDDDGGNPSESARQRIDNIWRKVGGGLREWQNALVLVAPDRELWDRAEQAVRDVLAYETVLDRKAKGADDISTSERKDLEARLKEKQESLRTSLVTA